jgi:cobaltochelatase CobS
LKKYPAKGFETCFKCGKTIAAGQFKQWDKTSKKGYMHADPPCSDATKDPLPAPLPTGATGFLENHIETLVRSVIAQHFDADKFSAKVKKDISKAIDKEMKSRGGTIKIQVPTPEGPKNWTGLAHVLFTKLVKLFQLRKHVFLAGPGGTGKSQAVTDAFDAIGLEWVSIPLNPMIMGSKFEGFMDAQGRFVSSVFYDAVKNGKGMLIDEVDAGSGGVLLILNQSLANGYASFANGEVIKIHDNFRLGVTGNTIGLGANHLYNERKQLDAAFKDRFVFLWWDFDTKLEREIVNTYLDGDSASQWHEFIMKTRDYCAKNHPKLLVSMRAAKEGASLLAAGFSVEEVLDDVVIKHHIDKESRQKLLSNIPLPAIEIAHAA